MPEQALALAPLLRLKARVDGAPAPGDLRLLSSQRLPAGVGERDEHRPPVDVAARPLEQPGPFQAIYEARGRRRRNPGPVSKLGHGNRGLLPELSQGVVLGQRELVSSRLPSGLAAPQGEDELFPGRREVLGIGWTTRFRRTHSHGQKYNRLA